MATGDDPATAPAIPPEMIPYIFGGAGNMTHEQLQRKRAIATAMASKSRGYPKTFGEGLASFGENIGEGLYERRLEQQERELAAREKAARDAPLPGVTPPVARVSEAPMTDPRVGVTAALAGPPPEVAPQPNPTLAAGGPQLNQPQLASLNTGTVTDAPPIGAENPATPTDIAPMPPTRVAQAGGAGAPPMSPGVPIAPAGVPGPLDAVPAVPPSPTAGRYAPDPKFRRPSVEPVAPTLGPLTPHEIRGNELLRDFGGNPQMKAYAERLIAQGASQRKAAYDRQVEKYKLEYGTHEKIDLAERERIANEKQTDLTMRKEEDALETAKRARDRAQRLGGIPEAAWTKMLEESHKEVKGVPATAMNIHHIRTLLNEGKMFTGLDAEFQLTKAKAQAALGFPPDPRIAGTEKFKSFIAPIVAQSRTMLVGNANISDKDMDASKQAAAGDPKLDRDSILGVLNVIETANTMSAVAHHKKLLTYAGPDQAEQRGAFGAYGVMLDNVVPDKAVSMLRSDPSATAIKNFDEAFHTPGLARRILNSRRGL